MSWKRLRRVLRSLWLSLLPIVWIGCGNKDPTGCGPTITPKSYTVSATLVDDGGTRTFLPGVDISFADCDELCGGGPPVGVSCKAEIGQGGAPVVVCQPGSYNNCV